LRGGSGWRGNVDSVLLCLPDRNPLTGECSNRSLIVEKRRDGPEGPIGAFELPVIQIGEDEAGEPFFSRAVRYTGEVSAKRPKQNNSEIVFGRPSIKPAAHMAASTASWSAQQLWPRQSRLSVPSFAVM
jgi:hypothetical protein